MSGREHFLTRHPRLTSGDICTGGRFNDGCGDGPAKEAYQIWTNYGCRWSWDPITVCVGGGCARASVCVCGAHDTPWLNS